MMGVLQGGPPEGYQFKAIHTVYDSTMKRKLYN